MRQRKARAYPRTWIINRYRLTEVEDDDDSEEGEVVMNISDINNIKGPEADEETASGVAVASAATTLHGGVAVSPSDVPVAASAAAIVHPIGAAVMAGLPLINIAQADSELPLSAELPAAGVVDAADPAARRVARRIVETGGLEDGMLRFLSQLDMTAHDAWVAVIRKLLEALAANFTPALPGSIGDQSNMLCVCSPPSRRLKKTF